jgi:ABC-type bacteriocin/lantibiotic exporter with double-glycine peptidase domain
MTREIDIAPARPRFAPWLLQPMLENKAIYLKVALAAAMINLFGLGSSLFSMTVYDRVVPNNATSSLIGLSIGLGIVVVFDFILRSCGAISSTWRGWISTASWAARLSRGCWRCGWTCARARPDRWRR